MQLNSYLFLLCFLPVFLIAYFLLSRLSAKVGNLFLLLASCAFYLYAGKRMFLVLLLDLGGNLVFLRLLRILSSERMRKWTLGIGIAANVGLLFYCKYLNFFLTNLNLPTRDILVPLGVSFFTFQQIAYLVDTYRGKTKDDTMLEYALYVLYFPKIAMGPITKAEVLIPQFRDVGKKRFSAENCVRGLRLFTLGLAKKVLLAETFASMVTLVHYYEVLGEAGGLEFLLLALGYTFELYFDFSGYTDMAQGVALMMNLTLADNFNSPYQAISIRDFWKRWHISLTSFLTEYLYFPLGGNRKGTARTYLNTMIVFLVSGFWHGANWTFVLWGALHGVLQCAERAGDAVLRKIPRVLRWLVTFVLVMFLWLLFQADSVSDWAHAMKSIFTPAMPSIHGEVVEAFLIPELTGMLTVVSNVGSLTMKALASVRSTLSLISMVAFFAVSFVICLCAKNTKERTYPNTLPALIGSAFLLVFCVVSLGSESTFVYYNF